MTTVIIGYGPLSEVHPYIPEFIILQTDDNIIKLGQDQQRVNLTPKTLDDLIASKQVKLFDGSAEYYSDQWIAIECDAPIILARFPLAENQKWAVGRASKLIEESFAFSHKEPLKAISVLQIAAGLCKIELSKLVQALEAKRKDPSEKLETILLRIKSELSKN